MKATPAVLALALLALSACDFGGRPGEGSAHEVHFAANRCFAVAACERGSFFPKVLAVASSGESFSFARSWGQHATPFFLKPSGLGRYLLHDDEGFYVVSDGNALLRQSELLSDILLVDDSFESDAE